MFPVTVGLSRQDWEPFQRVCQAKEKRHNPDLCPRSKTLQAQTRGFPVRQGYCSLDPSYRSLGPMYSKSSLYPCASRHCFFSRSHARRYLHRAETSPGRPAREDLGNVVSGTALPRTLNECFLVRQVIAHVIALTGVVRILEKAACHE